MNEKRFQFLNIHIDNLTMAESIQAIDNMIIKGGIHYVVTPNVDHIIKLEDDAEFREVYDNADLILTDGMPLIWISKLKKTPIKERVSGSDLFPLVCQLASQKGYSIFLLGAAEGVSENASKILQQTYKNINIVGTFSPNIGFENNKTDINVIIQMIKNAKPDILAIGLGAPKQEKFIYKYKDILQVPVSLGIGASIDFISGNIKRAPKWMQKNGLEWFFRFLKEPRRMFIRYFIKDLKIISIVRKYW